MDGGETTNSFCVQLFLFFFFFFRRRRKRGKEDGNECKRNNDDDTKARGETDIFEGCFRTSLCESRGQGNG